MASTLNHEFKPQIGAVEDDLRKNILDVAYPRHQKQISQLVGSKQKWTAPVIDRFNLTQALRRRAEKLSARSKPGRGVAGSPGIVKKSSPTQKPTRPDSQ